MSTPTTLLHVAERDRPVLGRDELFDRVVSSAIRSAEVNTGLGEAHGIDAEYLRSRCEQERERLWTDITGAAQFDATAGALRRTLRLGPALKPRALFVAPRLHRSGALAGLLVLLNSWWDYSPGPMDLSPNHLLLVVSMILVLVAGLATLFPAVVERALAGWAPTITRRVMVFSAPILVAASVVAMAFSVLASHSRDEIRRASGWDNTAETLFFGVLLGVGFLFSFMRSANGTPVPELQYNRDLITGFVLVLAIALTIALVLTSGDTYQFVLVGPNMEMFMAGLGLTSLSGLVALSGGRLQPLPVLRERYRLAERAAGRELATQAVLPLLRDEINKNTQNYDVDINVTDAPGLSQLSDPLYEVSTSATGQVEKLLTSMPGGSIGLAGSRGAGKTTLMESWCIGRKRPPGALTTMVSAPVEYSSREFLLHLYAKICREVRGTNDDADIDPLWGARLHRRHRLHSWYGLGVASVGLALMFLSRLETRPPAIMLWGALIAIIGLAVSIRATSRIASTHNAGRRARHRGLAELAAERLEEIRFQQSFTTTWSGSLKVPFGIEAMTGGGRGLTRQPLHLPEIVDSLREFLRRIAQEHRVIIGIDELDKMESETAAEQFLNEIKSVFGIRGCHFLVSVSEDAMSSFERRGLPFRDVFDSTFDEIVWCEPLTLAEATASIDRRVVLMPVPFKQLCYVLSGGLPRDLIRVARLAVNAQDPEQPSNLSQVAASLIAQDVRRKARAIAVAARRIDLEPDVSKFLVTCSNLSDAKIDAGSLQDLVDTLPPAVTTRAHRETTADASAHLRLVGEFSCFCYYAATVLDFFDEAADRDRWVTAGTLTGHSGLYYLAKARQAFAISTRVAWEGISRFRKSWGMATSPFPSELEPTSSPAAEQHVTRALNSKERAITS